MAEKPAIRTRFSSKGVIFVGVKSNRQKYKYKTT
jgi:hypothetical protein